MKSHIIRADYPDQVTHELAWVHKASDDYVSYVLSQPVGTGDGRSDWVWLRLPNGDLILGVFPQGATYEYVEPDAGWRG